MFVDYSPQSLSLTATNKRFYCYFQSRVALSEQLSKNRELTQDLKVKDKDSDDSADESDVTTNIEKVQTDSNNPWVPGSDDFNKFISSYKKYYAETAPRGNSAESASHVDSAESVSHGDSVEQNSLEQLKTTTDEGNDSEPGEVEDMPQHTVQEVENSPKLKKPKKKSVVRGKVEEELKTNDECALIKEITNSSGSWTVSKLPAAENSSNVKSKKNKKSSESGSSSNVSDMFESLEEKISKKLKRKISEVRNSNTIAFSFITLYLLMNLFLWFLDFRSP